MLSVRLLTTAPQYFDLPGIIEVNAKAGLTAGHSNLRLVEIPENLLEEQIVRYDENFNCIVFIDNIDELEKNRLVKIYEKSQLFVGTI